MESEIVKIAVQYGIFAVLFVALLFYVLRTNEKREDKYQKTIEANQVIIKDLTEKFCVVDAIKDDVAYIKDEMKRR